MSVLIFREGTRREQERVQGALRAAVAGRWADPVKAWPEYFGKPASEQDDAFPEAGADMSDFQWEAPGAEAVAAELEQMMHGARVRLMDGPPAAAPPPREPEAELRPMTSRMGPASADELEWG